MSERIPRSLSGAVVAAALLAWGGCAGRAAVTPAAPTPAPAPEPTPAPEPPEEDEGIPFALGGAFFFPERTLEVPEGTTIGFEVQSLWINDWTNGGATDGYPIGIATDAPANRLSVPDTVFVDGARVPGLLEITALSAGGEVSDEYRVWLTRSPDEFLAPGFFTEVDPTPIRLRVRRAEERPSPTCLPPTVSVEVEGAARAGGSLAARVFGFDGLSYWAGDWTFRVPTPGTAVTLTTPYRRPFAGEPEAPERAWLPHRPALLASAFETRETPTGLEQRLTLGWFADLHLLVESPGCPPVEASCTEGRCTIR